MNLVQNIGQATSRPGGWRSPSPPAGAVVVTALFCFAVTPIGFLLRPTAKRFLESEPDPGGDSYWVKRDPTRRVYYEKPC